MVRSFMTFPTDVRDKVVHAVPIQVTAARLFGHELLVRHDFTGVDQHLSHAENVSLFAAVRALLIIVVSVMVVSVATVVLSFVEVTMLVSVAAHAVFVPTVTTAVFSSEVVEEAIPALVVIILAGVEPGELVC